MTAANFGSKLALAPAPPVPSSKVDTPRPKPISKPGLRVDQANKEEVKLITPVKAGSKSPLKDHDPPVRMLNPLKIRRTPENNDKEDLEDAETEKEVFYSSHNSPTSHTFMEDGNCEGGGVGFFDDAKAMSVGMDLFGDLSGEGSFLRGEGVTGSMVSSGFFSSDQGQAGGNFGNIFDGNGSGNFFDGPEDSGAFSLFGDDKEKSSGGGGFSLF